MESKSPFSCAHTDYINIYVVSYYILGNFLYRQDESVPVTQRKHTYRGGNLQYFFFLRKDLSAGILFLSLSRSQHLIVQAHLEDLCGHISSMYKHMVCKEKHSIDFDLLMFTLFDSLKTGLLSSQSEV